LLDINRFAVKFLSYFPRLQIKKPMDKYTQRTSHVWKKIRQIIFEGIIGGKEDNPRLPVDGG
jgi:hypothetical protein